MAGSGIEMKYVQINAFSYGSTGRLMFQRHAHLTDKGVESYVCWARGRGATNEREYKIGTKADVYTHALYTRVTDRVGFGSKRATIKLIQWLDSLKPDVVHLHVLHGYYINIEILFNWLKKESCQVVWTLHDCWSFTGHCAHFIRANCSQWKSGCGEEGNCPQLGEYPKTYCRSGYKQNYIDKRRIFTSVPYERMTLVVPSHWLENKVKESFLRKYVVRVEPNEVDASRFKFTQSDFRQKNGIEGTYMVLGVASPWTRQKGLYDFIRLAQDLDEGYSIVMVGITPRQRRRMPGRIHCLQRTNSARELAEIYSAADLFVNPSLEETFSMTVAEAQACGTAVLVRRGTACEEVANPQLCHVAEWSYESLLKCVRQCKELSARR